VQLILAMNTKIVSLFLAAACAAFGQYHYPMSNDALITSQLNSDSSGVIYDCPPAPSSGNYAILIYDHVTDLSHPFVHPAKPGPSLYFDPVTETLDAYPLSPIRTTTAGVSHSLNSAFQVSATHDAFVSYTVQIAATISLTTGQSGTISIQLSPNNTTYTTAGSFTNGNTGTLTIGLNLTNTQAGQVQAYVPAGYYVKLVSSGTATSTYQTGQETLL
jgi:hypothetical protein